MLYKRSEIRNGTGFDREARFLEVRPVVTDEGHTFEPWSDGWAVGFKVTHDDGRVEFIYLNPSSSDEETGRACVFTYQSTAEIPDAAMDEPLVYHDLFTEGN